MFTIKNKEFAGKIVRFDNLPFGCTDMDGLVDYHNRIWFIIEAKTNNSPMPRGQRIALERLCDDLGQVKPTFLIVAENEPDLPEIDLAICKVRQVRTQKEYRNFDGSVGEFIQKVIDVLG